VSHVLYPSPFHIEKKVEIESEGIEEQLRIDKRWGLSNNHGEEGRPVGFAVSSALRVTPKLATGREGPLASSTHTRASIPTLVGGVDIVQFHHNGSAIPAADPLFCSVD
jgi:hypothetical protein